MVITISLEEYAELQRDSRMLAALQAGGVDNWEWYDESLASFYEEEEGDE